MANVFFELATGLFDTEFDGDTGVITVSQISGWLSNNVGSLNVLLHTNFTGDSPDFDDAAGDIFQDLYLSSYYSRAARNALRGVIAASNSDNILSIGDADNKISFINKNEVAKVYRGLSNDVDASIKQAASNYHLYASQAVQVVGYDGSYSGVYSF